MIKRELHTAITNRDIEEILDHISGETKIVSHVVDSLGTHYIITERQMTDDEHKKFKIIEVRNKIAKCNADYERRIQACEQAIHRHNVSLEYEMANLYMQRREDLIEEYNEEQRKLTIKLDKLQKSL